MKRTKVRYGIGFWKFLIVLTLVFNAINFYFISGLYNVLGGGDFSTPLSNTAITGYLVLGNSTLIGMILLIVIVGVYAIFRK